MCRSIVSPDCDFEKITPQEYADCRRIVVHRCEGWRGVEFDDLAHETILEFLNNFEKYWRRGYNLKTFTWKYCRWIAIAGFRHNKFKHNYCELFTNMDFATEDDREEYLENLTPVFDGELADSTSDLVSRIEQAIDAQTRPYGARTFFWTQRNKAEAKQIIRILADSADHGDGIGVTEYEQDRRRIQYHGMTVRDQLTPLKRAPRSAVLRRLSDELGMPVKKVSAYFSFICKLMEDITPHMQKEWGS